MTHTHSTRELALTCRIIESQEAFSLRPATLIHAKNRLTAQLNDTVRNLTTWNYTRPEVINQSPLANVVRRRDYIEDLAMSLPMPVGFVTTVSDQDIPRYVASLEGVFEHLLTLYTMLERQYVPVLSHYINDPTRLKEHPDPALYSRLKEMMATGDNVDETVINAPVLLLKKYMNAERQNEGPLKALYPNYTSLIDTVARINTLNQRRFKELNTGVVAKNVRRIEALGATLLRTIERDKPTQENLEVILNIIRLFAEWTHTYAVVTTMIIDVTTALKHTEKQLLA